MFSKWFRNHRADAGELPAVAGIERAKIAPSLPPGVRIYAIGDIHGKLELLIHLQRQIAQDLQANPPASARLVYLGDYIDRGGHSRQVVERLLDPPPELPPAILLRGNHEQTLLDCLENPRRLEEWCSFGGLETLMSYGVAPALLRNRADPAATMAAFAIAGAGHMAFFQKLEYCVEFGDYFFCHAGVKPGVALQRQSSQDLLWIREEFLASRADFGRVIVHGHTPTNKPEVRGNRINVDTGAYASRILTAVVLEGSSIRFLST